MDINNLKEADKCVLFYRKVYALQGYNQLSRDIVLVHNANEHLGSRNYTQKLLRMGMLPGLYDYTAYAPFGCTEFIEFKRNAKCKLTPTQENFKNRMEGLGFPCHTVFEVDHAVDILYALEKKIKRVAPV